MEANLYAAFLSRYPRDEYALMEEVCEHVQGGGRRADALVLNLWSSRGHELQGFEVKSYRGDWLREKGEPAKAEALAKYCDRWWLVATEPGIVLPDELPPTWGLLELRAKKLVQVVKAPKLKALARPWSFVCSMVRRAQDDAKAAAKALRDEVRAEVKAELEQFAATRAGSPEALQAKVDVLETLISTFNEKAGVYLTDWSLGDIAAAVRMVQEAGKRRGVVGRLERLREEARDIEEHIAKVLKDEEEAHRSREGAA